MDMFQCGSCCHSQNEKRLLQQSRPLGHALGKEWRQGAVESANKHGMSPTPLGGVGIYFRVSGGDLVVVGVNPDGPASASLCIQPEDRLVAIDNLQVLRTCVLPNMLFTLRIYSPCLSRPIILVCTRHMYLIRFRTASHPYF